MKVDVGDHKSSAQGGFLIIDVVSLNVFMLHTCTPGRQVKAALRSKACLHT